MLQDDSDFRSSHPRAFVHCLLLGYGEVVSAGMMSPNLIASINSFIETRGRRRRAITRKDLLQLLIVVLIGWGAAQLLRKTVPLGREMGTSMRALAMLQDEASPRRDVSAPTLTMVVFTDYQCPACKLANPAMNAAVAKDGHVRIIYRDWPIFGPRSQDAARVALASARQGIYLSVHDRLLAERRKIDEAAMREAVEASGGDWVRLQQDLRADRMQIDSELARNAADATSIGIAGTPAYLMGSTLVTGALDVDEFSRAFAAARAEKK